MATKKPTTKTPTTKAPTTTTKKTYVDKTSSYNQELINKAQSYMTGTDYVAGKPVDTSFWGSSGGGGKNTLYGNAGTKTYAGKEFTTKDMNAIAKYVAEQDKLAANKALADAQNAGYNAAMGEVEGMVQSSIAPIQQMYANMQEQQNAAYQQALQASAGQINNAYDMSARDYYQFYKTQQAKLPENLSRAGVTGGASESAQLKLMNNYSESLYKNEAARNNQLAGVNQNYNDKIAQNSINAANQMANAYLQMAQQQLAYKRQDELAQKEQQAKAELEAQYRAIDQWNANVEKRMQEQLAKGDTIWTWTDDDGKKHWTTYEAVGLSKGGKKLAPDNSKTKSSSSSSKSSGSSNTTPATVTTNTPSSATSYSYDTLKYNMTNALLKGASKQQLQVFTKPIEAAYNSGKITEKQAKELLKMLGA